MAMIRNILDRIENLGRVGATLSRAEADELDSEIDNVVSHIKSANDYIAATSSLDELGALQELLSLLLFKYDVFLSVKQKAVVRGFDRFDDPELRLAIYKAVKEGRFP